MGETRIMAFWTLYLSNGKQVVHGTPFETTDDNSLRNDSGNSQSESKMQHGLEGRWAGKKRRAEFQGGFLGGIHRPTRHPDYIRKSRDAKRYREWHFTLYTLHDCFRIHFHLKAKTAARYVANYHRLELCLPLSSFHLQHCRHGSDCPFVPPSIVSGLVGCEFITDIQVS